MAQTASERTAGNLRAEMARQRISVRKLAGDLGWSTSTASRRVRGALPLDIDELADAAAYLGVPVSVLLASTTEAVA